MLKVFYVTGTLRKRLTISMQLFKCAFSSLLSPCTAKICLLDFKDEADREYYQKLEKICDEVNKKNGNEVVVKVCE